MSGIDVDIQELKQIFEQELVFKPAGPSQIGARKEQALQRKKKGMAKFASNWTVYSLTVPNPFHGDDTVDADTGMWKWWKNNKQWKERGITKVDADWNRITFVFNEPKTSVEATKLVNDFIQDWANKPATKNKVLTIGDMVYLKDPEEERHYYWNLDSGRITAVTGNKVRVRFHHHGNADIDASKMTFDKEHNCWEVTPDAEFKQMMTTKKGVPKVGTTCSIVLPKEHRLPPNPSFPQQDRSNTTWGKIEEVNDDSVVVSYEIPREDWNKPRVQATTKIKITDLTYDWRDKKWVQRGAER